MFEQFITVEMIGFDEEGNEHRRIAGCTSDGMPRRRASGDSGNIELFNLSGDISRKWNPNPDTEIDLSATVGFKHTCRATYDISWSRFFVKLTRDLIITAKPTIGIASTHSFDENVGWLDIGLRKIKFPAAAPFFEIDPFPDLFVRGSGLLEARFNLPAVRLGVGDDLIFDTNNLFPIWYTLHFTPDAADAVPDEMLDLSAQVKMEASLQFGVKFNATVSTNSWFKKILFAEVGLHLYTGPKIGGSVTLKADAEGISLYESLSNAIINYSLLSLDLEAKAKAAAFWNDPEEKTFFSKSLAFFCDTVRFAPSFDSIRVLEMTKNDVAIELYPNKSRLMTLPTLTMGVWDQKSGGTPIMKEGSWSMNPKKDIKYTISLPLNKFKAMHTYYVSPIVDLPGRGEFEVRSMVAEFTPPYTMELESDSLSFPGNGGTAEVNFTTNCPKENIKLLIGGKIQYQATTSLEVIDEEHGHYKAVFTANPNPSLFDISVPKDSVTLGISPEIVLGYDTQNMKRFFLGAYQAEFEFSDKIPVQFYAECDGRYKVQYEGAVTAERNGKNIIQFAGNQSDWFDCTSAGCYTEGDGVVQRCELEGAISRDPITGKITCSVAGTARQSVSETESRKAAEYTTSASASFDLQLGGMGFGSEWWGSNAGEIKSGYFTSQISGEGEYSFDWMNWIEGHSSSVIKPKFAVKLSIP